MTNVTFRRAELVPEGKELNRIVFTYQAEAFGVAAEIQVMQVVKGDDVALAEAAAREKLNAFFLGYTPTLRA